MKLVLKNLRILNPGGESAYIENGSIAISGGKIDAVGDNLNVDEKLYEVIDMCGKTVLPGMINAHAHLYSALAMGMPAPKNQPTNFSEVLKEVWWKLDLALDADSTLASYETGLMDSLRSGVTTVLDHHSSQAFIPGSLSLLAEVANRFGMNISTAFEITDRNGAETFEAGLKENFDTMEKYADDPFVQPLIGLHASFTVEDDSLRKIADALVKYPAGGIHIHLAEDKADQVDAEKRGYGSIVQRLNEFGLINGNSLIIHGIHMIPGDVEILQNTGAMLVHNPTSNANNRVGMLSAASIETLQAGLGTDGMQGNMLAEAKEGMLIRSSHLAGGALGVDYSGLLFKNNPRIASKLWGTRIGHIMPGYTADLAIYDYVPRTQIHAGNMIGHIFFGMGKPSDVMTRGQFRIRNDEFIDISESELLRFAQTQSKVLWDKMSKM